MRTFVALGLLGLIGRGAYAEEAFRDYGVGAKVAENRGVVTTVTQKGQCLVIAHALDWGKTGFILVTDIDTGRTTQHFCPSNIPQEGPFGALISSQGKFYTTQGKWLLEFDPNVLQWTFQCIPSKDVSHYMGFTEGPDGVVWAGGAYKTALISYNPTTREVKDNGVLDPVEQYLSYMAVDKSGWVYGGIGTARCNIVAFNPQTGEKRQLLKEEERVHGTASVVPSTDGAVYGRAGNVSYRLFEGKATQIESAKIGPPLRVGNIMYGGRICDFPDGRRVTFYDLPGRLLKVEDPKTKAVKEISFDYQTEGVFLTSLAEGPDGMVYASSCHPMHLIKLDTGAGKMQDLGPIPAVGGGNFCAMARQRGFLIGAQYAHGRLWAYDVSKPWAPGAKDTVLGIPAQELMKGSECKDGHFTHLTDLDAAFLCGDKFGAEGTFRLTVPADGKYYLHIQPLVSKQYCSVQFLFDDKPIGGPFDAKDSVTKFGPLQVHGPMDLKAGEHRLTVRTLESPGQMPWVSICSVELSAEKRDRLVRHSDGNPYVLAEWHDDICRPRTALAHPDGKHVMMAGFAGYGFCGGGIGIYNLETNEATLFRADTDLLSGHSCITLQALPSGDLVGGTSVDAPGGGHTVATEGELFILDWKTKKVVFRTVPVPGDRNITSIVVPSDGLVYGLSSNATFFVFDPKAKKMLHSEPLKDYGAVPRHPLLLAPDGGLYAMMGKAILRIATGTFQHEKIADPPTAITAGGALVNGQLCFAGNSHVWTFKLPGPK